MTNEQAIDILKAARFILGVGTDETDEAFSMAISAMKAQQAAGDTISRSAALEACYNGWNKDYKKIAQDIKDLPTAQPKRCDSSNILRYPECKNRTKLGNCNPVGGFCTSVPKDICDAQNHRQNAVDIIHIDPAKITMHGVARDKLWEEAIKREKKELPPEPPHPQRCDSVPTIELEKTYSKNDYIMALHKEYGCTIAEAKKAHDLALEYLQSITKIRG